MDNTVPSGFTPESDNNILKELKSINETLLSLVKNLNLTTNSKVFTDSSYFDKVFDKYSARSDKANEDTTSKSTASIDKTLSSTKESMSNIQDLIKNYEKYAESNSEFQKISKTRLEDFLDLQKKQNFIQEKLLTASQSQEGIINNIYKSYSKQAEEKLEDIRNRRVTSGSIQPEEREINKAKYRSGLKMVPEGIAQAFMNTKDSSSVGSLFSGIGGLVKVLNESQGGRTKEQYNEAVSERQQDAEKTALKNLDLYKYNINKPDEAEELVNRHADESQKIEYNQASRLKERLEPAKEKVDTYTEGYFKPVEKETIDSVDKKVKPEAKAETSSFDSVLDYIRKKDSTKIKPVDHESIMAQLRAIDPSKKPRINIAPEILRGNENVPTVEVKPRKSRVKSAEAKVEIGKKETFPTVKELKEGLSLESGGTEKEYSVNGISPQQVKSVLGSHGIGYLYLGEVIQNSLGKDKKETEVEKKKEGGSGIPNIGGAGAGVLSLLTPALLGTIASLAITAALGAGLVALVFTEAGKEASERAKKAHSEGLQIGAEVSYEKKEEGHPQAGQFSQAVGMASSYLPPKEEVKKVWIERVKEKALAGDSNAKIILDYYAKNYSMISGNAFMQTLLNSVEGKIKPVGFTDFIKKAGTEVLKYHKGGIIGQKEILAQKGEVILPVDDSQYGLDSGMLKKTDDGGVSINRNITNQNTQNNNMNTEKLERLMQELLSVVSTNLIGAIKENKPEQSKQMIVPNINLNTLSYRG